MKSPREAGALRPLPSLIFASRWLQLQVTAAIAAPLKRGEASGLLASGGCFWNASDRKHFAPYQPFKHAR